MGFAPCVGWDYVASLRFPFLRGPSTTEAKVASADADSTFLFPVFAYESKLSTLRRKTKKRNLMRLRFCFGVIRLERARLNWAKAI